MALSAYGWLRASTASTLWAFARAAARRLGLVGFGPLLAHARAGIGVAIWRCAAAMAQALPRRRALRRGHRLRRPSALAGAAAAAAGHFFGNIVEVAARVARDPQTAPVRAPGPVAGGRSLLC